MTINAIARLSIAAAVGTTFSLLATDEAFAYTFTKIGSSNFAAVTSPSLNDEGTVAFWVYLDPPGTPNRREALFTGNGGLPTLIADNSGAFKFFLGGSSHTINKEDTVAFFAQLAEGGSGIFTSNNGVINTIADSKGSFAGFGFPVINNEGTIAFWAELDNRRRGIFTSNNGVITNIATASPFSFLSATINNKGIVAFSQLNAFTEKSGIFISNGQTTTTIAESSNPSTLLSSPAINDEGSVALIKTELDTGVWSILIFNGGKSAKIADTSGLFSNFFPPGINNRGTVAFQASLDTGVKGIFTGSDPLANKVIATGDTFFGAKVKDLRFSRSGLNNSGQIAFYAQFEDGTSGFFRADPDAPKSVPEPASVLGLLAVGALGIISRPKRQLS
ncbi:choice-of-anchor tandem repeat NxxGxxAF-containing protein [Microseira sp. BLCC-F43]|uniref:DUF7453 family protein n=1 Tax=Microseira sp. BLCC-F43 TaxID=3153602 RepID=UPI0035BB8E66